MESNQKLEPSPQLFQTSVQSRKIALALSGGGFRATLFHLGVVRALRDCDLLKDVKLICSVSGGSILAAHLALNWDTYLTPKGFDEAAGEVINCVTEDVRNLVLRRWICATSFFWLPRLIGFGKPSKVLANQYDRLLYKKATFDDLRAPGTPEIHILSTSLTTGSLCRFTNSHFEIRDGKKSVPLGSQRVAFAVAASSAFPPLFPAVPVNHKVLHCNRSEFNQEHFLTDGGVYDNLAIEDLTKSGSQYDLLIVSDASANFDDKTDKYATLVSLSRNLRANDIMMHRLAEMSLAPYKGSDSKLLPIKIQDRVDQSSIAIALHPSIQNTVKNIQTDLSVMPDEEIDALIRHGQATTWNALKTKEICSHTHTGWLPVEDTLANVDVENFDSLLKRLRRDREVDCLLRDWALLITLVVWMLLLWGGWELYKLTTEEPGEKQHYVIHVTAGNKPLAGAQVYVRLEDADKTTHIHSGYTTEDGNFSFDWKLKKHPTWAHFSITKPGSQEFDDDFILKPEPEHKVSLAPANNSP